MTKERTIRLATRLAAAFLLVVPLVPLVELFGSTRGISALVPVGEWLQGVAIFGILAWVAAAFLTLRADEILSVPGRLASRLSTGAALAIGLAALSGVLWIAGRFAFHHRPHLVDSIAQLFQARAFAQGLLAAPVPGPVGFFAVPHVLIEPGGWYAQYPPGHSALLALGLLAGAAWVVPVLLSLGSFALLVLFARRIYGRDEALVVALLLLFCPFFWFMGASFMNHVSSLFWIALLLYAFARWEEGERARWLAVAGAAVGGAFLSRPWDAIAVGAPFGLIAGTIAWRRRAFGAAAGGVAAFLAVAALYFAFNAATSGDPFLPGYVKLWGESHGLGFHLSPWGELHTPATGLRNELIDLSLLNVFLFEWPIPALWPAALFLLVGRGVGRWDRRLLVGLLALPAAYFFYWHRDAFLGPRFFYPAVAFAVPLTARALLVGARRLRGRGLGLPGVLKPADGGLFVVALAGVCLVYAAAYSIPQRFRIYATGLSSMKLDLPAEARAAGIERGVIFVATSWGDRMVSRLYDAGVSAPLAEQVYRHADHCEMEEVIARGEGGPAARLEDDLRALMAGPRAPRLRQRINDDPTLRLIPGRPVTRRCVDEIMYDRGGFTIYPPHLLDNRMPVSEPLVVARDLRDRNAELAARHPGLPAYLYRPGRFEPLEGLPGAGVDMPTVRDSTARSRR